MISSVKYRYQGASYAETQHNLMYVQEESVISPSGGGVFLVAEAGLEGSRRVVGGVKEEVIMSTTDR